MTEEKYVEQLYQFMKEGHSAYEAHQMIEAEQIKLQKEESPYVES